MKSNEWKPIGTAPKGVKLLFAWRNKDDISYPEDVVTGQISRHEDGKWWDGLKYQNVWHLTHWMDLPVNPRATDISEAGKCK